MYIHCYAHVYMHACTDVVSGSLLCVQLGSTAKAWASDCSCETIVCAAYTITGHAFSLRWKHERFHSNPPVLHASISVPGVWL